MSRKLSLIILISLVFLASISAISAADENNDTISACEYDTSTDLNTNNLNFDDNSLVQQISKN